MAPSNIEWNEITDEELILWKDNSTTKAFFNALKIRASELLDGLRGSEDFHEFKRLNGMIEGIEEAVSIAYREK